MGYKTVTPNFILLRGLARESRHWGEFPEVLQKAFPQSKIEQIDVAGNGSEVNRDSYTKISLYTEDLRRRSQLIQQKAKPIVIGISLGGMITADWSSRYPDELAGAVLMNTSDGSSAKLYQRLRWGGFKKLAEMLTVTHDREAIELKALELTSNRTENYSRYLKEFSKTPRTKFRNFSKQLFAASHFHFSKTKPSIPLLILGSKGDKMVSYKCSESIAKMWQAPVQIHQDAGHDLSLDEPQWVTEQIQKWEALIK
jgi:pimeloyl-ACP methyl ester carboxylesterase